MRAGDNGIRASSSFCCVQWNSFGMPKSTITPGLLACIGLTDNLWASVQLENYFESCPLKQRLRNVFLSAGSVIVLTELTRELTRYRRMESAWYGLSKIEYVIDLFESRIKPPIIVFTLENHRHSVMNVRQKCICRRCDDRTRFDHLPLRILHRSQIPANAKTESSRG